MKCCLWTGASVISGGRIQPLGPDHWLLASMDRIPVVLNYADNPDTLLLPFAYAQHIVYSLALLESKL